MTTTFRAVMSAAIFGMFATAANSTNMTSSMATTCTTTYVQNALPFDAIPGVVIDTSSLTVNAVYNASFTGSDFFPDHYGQSYCNVTFTYSHTDKNGSTIVWYWLPAPENFQNRYLSTGGGGFSITSTDTSIPGGIAYGATAGTTDGGFGSFDTTIDEVVLNANGSLNYDQVYNFGYKAIHELTVLGKALTRDFFSMATDQKLYAYYQACSEGGREGWSQVQRYPEDWDGAIIGAPAMRYSHQQLGHLSAAVVDSYLGIYPTPCALDKLASEMLAFCDPLDGKTDGVVSRSDLCKLQLNLDSFIGMEYSCNATAASTNPYNPQPATPAQSGTIIADDVLIANHTLNGPMTVDGKRVYVGWQPGSGFGDADTVYDTTTGNWTYSLQTYGVLFAEKFIREQDLSTIPDFDTWTPDTLRDMIYAGWQKFEDSLQTTWPDLTAFKEAGGKIVHFHRESDSSVPPASSVRYHESVRSVMYPDVSFDDSIAAMNKWYRLYLVDGAAHCTPDTSQCRGAFPQTNFPVMIDWVENGIEPVTLNATVINTCADNYGSNSQICSWPLRSVWSTNGTSKPCEMPTQEALDTWYYDLNAFPMTVY